MPLWRTKNGKWRARWYADGTAKGRRVMKTWPAHLTHAEADRLYKIELAKAAGRRGRTVPRDLTVAEAVVEYLAARKGTLGPDTFRNASATFNANMVRLLGPKRIETLRPSDFIGYQARRTEEGAAPATVNHELTMLRTMFNTLTRWQWLDATPLPAGSVPPLKAPQGRTDFFSVDDWKRLLAELDTVPPPAIGKRKTRQDARPMIPAIRALLYTGARLNEVLRLTWQAVDFEENRIVIQRYKTSTTSGIRISAPLLAVLKAQPRGTPAAYVFPGPDGEPWKAYQVQNALTDARDRAGLRKTLTTHSLRHAFISWLIMDGVPLKTVSELAGHKDVLQTSRYAHLSPTHLQTAIDRIGAIEDGWKPSAVNPSPQESDPIPIDRGRRL